MSIRISHGNARVELDSFDFRVGDRATTDPIYPTDDLIEAVRRALQAADDDRADALAALLNPQEADRG